MGLVLSFLGNPEDLPRRFRLEQWLESQVWELFSRLPAHLEKEVEMRGRLVFPGKRPARENPTRA